MRIMLWAALLLVVVLVSLSAYLRLAHSGIGCADWPACYGLIDEPQPTGKVLSTENVYQRIVAEASQPLAWATPLHRLVASVLGLLVVFMTLLGWRRKRRRVMTTLLLVITVLLALLGLKSGSLHSPAVMMGNLGGGFLMLGMLGWMLFTDQRSGNQCTQSRPLNVLVTTAAIVLVLQILLGGLTSANFAATACRTLPDCNGSYLPGAALVRALDITRNRAVTPQGQVTGGAERIAIHKAHRLGAVLAAVLMLMTALLAWRTAGRFRLVSALLALLVLVEFIIGVAAVLKSLPIGLAVAHNWLAGLLLLGLLKTAALNRGIRQA